MNGKDEKLESNVEVEVLVDELTRHFLRYNILKIFEKFPYLEDSRGPTYQGKRFSSRRIVNLFKNRDKIGKDKLITPLRIEETINWIKKYAKASSGLFLEDLDWSHHCLINSMDKQLQDSVHSTLTQDYGRVEVGGPLMFSILVEKSLISQNQQ